MTKWKVQPVPKTQPRYKKIRNYSRTGVIIVLVFVLIAVILYSIKSTAERIKKIEASLTDQPCFPQLIPPQAEISAVRSKLEAFKETPEAGLILSSHELNVLVASWTPLSSLRNRVHFQLITDDQLELIASLVWDPHEKIPRFVDVFMTIKPEWNEPKGRWVARVSKIEPISAPEAFHTIRYQYENKDYLNLAPQPVKELLSQVFLWQVKCGELCLNIKHPSMPDEDTTDIQPLEKTLQEMFEPLWQKPNKP